MLSSLVETRTHVAVLFYDRKKDEEEARRALKAVDAVAEDIRDDLRLTLVKVIDHFAVK